MKVLLVNPSRTYQPGSKGVRLGLPLGLMNMAAILEKNSIPIKIFDSLISEGTKIEEHSNYIFHGVSDDFLEEVIAKEKPDVVGISSPFTAQLENLKKCVDLIREINPRTFIIVGGAHFAVLGQEFLQENKDVDAALAGEGEVSFLKLVKALENKTDFSGVPGLIYRALDNSEAIFNKCELIKELDSLPMPAYHLVDMERYFHFLEHGLFTRPGTRGKRAISMITSRGCPFDCVFCSIHLHMGRRFRAHSARYTVSHIQYVVDNYKVEHISFEDDNFTLDKARCSGILNQIIDKSIKISWDTPNGIRADTLDKDLLLKMKESGCDELIIGVESGDQEVLNKIVNKNLSLDKVGEAAEWCKKFAIKLSAFFVIGFPGETKEKIQKTIDFAFWLYKKFDVLPHLNTAAPLLGTRLLKIAREKGYLTSEVNAKSLGVATQTRGKGLIKTLEFTPQDLKEFDRQLDRRIKRLKLVRALGQPKQYFKILKLFFTKFSKR